ncbi:MAG: CoA transferase [Deltaproteobacteria bacterium]|nr:CoA transferase [Deltaproteobacteria bacterium]
MLSVLRGVRVLDLTRMVAGPYGAMLLADLGAEVIKIERPGGDEVRGMGPHFRGDLSVYFAAFHRSKRSMVLDLTRPEGRAVLLDLAAQSDVVIENFRVGVAERLGCDAVTLHARNPRLIVCGMTGLGRTGPDRMDSAFDLTLQARGGTMSITGEPERVPVRMGPPMGDLAGGMFGALAIAAALYERERSGRGHVIDLSLLDCQVALLGYAATFALNADQVLGPQGSAHAHAWPYQAFVASDGPLVIAVFTDRFWQGFCTALGDPAKGSDPRYATHAQRRAAQHALLAWIEPTLLSQTVAHWLALLRQEQVPCAAVQSVDQVFADPQVKARAMVAELAQPHGEALFAAGNPMKIDDSWEHERHGPVPGLGEHTREVLRQVCAYTEQDIDALVARGVLGDVAGSR